VKRAFVSSTKKHDSSEDDDSFVVTEVEIQAKYKEASVFEEIKAAQPKDKTLAAE